MRSAFFTLITAMLLLIFAFVLVARFGNALEHLNDGLLFLWLMIPLFLVAGAVVMLVFQQLHLQEIEKRECNEKNEKVKLEEEDNERLKQENRNEVIRNRDQERQRVADFMRLVELSAKKTKNTKDTSPSTVSEDGTKSTKNNIDVTEISEFDEAMLNKLLEEYRKSFIT